MITEDIQELVYLEHILNKTMVIEKAQKEMH
jgi:hypothetical protein